MTSGPTGGFWTRRAPRILLLLLACSGSAFEAREAAANGVTHHLTFVNRCKEPIWLAELGTPDVDPSQWALAPTCNAANAARVCPSGTCDQGFCSCQHDADCSFDQTVSPAPSCDQGTGRCIKSTMVAVDDTWSGRFWARTRCTGSSGTFACETGQCGGPGNVECTVSANVATLFELTGGGYDAVDVFDVSLASGYNVPIAAKAILPPSSPQWTPGTSYAQNAQIVERVGKDVFLFQNTGSAGTSGGTRPAFPGVLFENVADGADIVWTNLNAVCEPSGCRASGIREHHCPPVLRVMSGGEYIGCNAPANTCGESGSGCEDRLDYYQCQNNGGALDEFGKVLTLQSANGASYVCFSAADCPPGTTCELDPEFESGYRMPKGSGLCTPIAQNGGCQQHDDGRVCPDVGFPFVDYRCQTLKNVATNAQVCVPPKTRGVGELWWNAHNWTPVPTPTPSPSPTPGSTETPSGSPPPPTPTPTPICTQDSDCAAAQKCLLTPPSPNGGLKQCPGDRNCSCWNPTTCTSSSQCVPGKCLDQNGVENAACATTETCYCAPQGIYSGTCGATNPKWLQAGRKISVPGARWPQTFKERCPRAYSFQFDDPSSSWSCPNPSAELTDYRIVFCGGVGE